MKLHSIANRWRHGSRGSSQGFTLIELMVTLTIAAVLAMLAAPSFNAAILSNKLSAFANSFVASTQLARSEAIKRNSTVRICRSNSGTSCATTGSWQQGWIVFHDANNNSVADAGETVMQVQQAISSDYHFTGDAYDLAFQAIGAGATNSTLILCRALPTAGNQERTITLSATGRTSVQTTKNGSCA